MNAKYVGTSSEQSYRRLSKAVREAAGESGSSCPIVLVDGFWAPELKGRSWCYRTAGGTLIRHPSAYSRSGWSNMVYHHSTRRIEVGRGWLTENGLDEHFLAHASDK